MATAIEPYRDLGGDLTQYSRPTPDEGGDRIDLRTLSSMFRRRIGVFLVVLLSVLVLGILITLMQTPTYTAEAQVALNARQDQIVPVGQTDTASQPSVPGETYVDTQVAVIGSESMAARVVDALKLAESPKFAAPLPPTGLKGAIKRALGMVPKVEKFTKADALAEAIAYVQAGVTPTRNSTTYALKIDFQSNDPEEAARIANTFAAQYTNGALERRRQANATNRDLVAQRLNEIRATAQADTDAVQRYRNAHGLLSTTGASLTEQEISSYNQAVAAARAEAAENEARLATAKAQLRSGSEGDDVGEALGSPVIGALRNSQTEALSNVAQLTARYGPLHPDVIKAKSQLAAINGQIQAEIRRVVSNLDAKRQVSDQRLASLSRTLGGAQGNLADTNRSLPGLNDLQKRAETSEALYESYLNRYKELSAREGTEQADASILTPAPVPTSPTSPNLVLNTALAIAVGLGLGLAAAFLTEMAFSGVTTGDDVEQRIQTRYLGSIPSLGSVMKGRNLSPISAITSDPRSAFAESFRSLRASILFAGAGPAKVIAIASALPQEGKTTTAICLARSMALTGDNVILVDCDLRRHGVSRFLRQDAERPGLTEVLRGEAKLEDALIFDSASGMAVLPVARSSSVDAELLLGDAMDKLLDVLRARFSAIIIDTAPVLPIADARLVLGKADLAVFAVRWRSTPDHAVKSAFRMLPKDRVRLAGVVLTQVDMRKQARFGYGDDSFNYRAYKSYYA